MSGLPLARLGGGRHRHLPPGSHPVSLHLALHLPRPLQEEQTPRYQPGGGSSSSCGWAQHSKLFCFEEANVKGRAKHVRHSAESNNTHVIIESTRL